MTVAIQPEVLSRMFCSMSVASVEAGQFSVLATGRGNAQADTKRLCPRVRALAKTKAPLRRLRGLAEWTGLEPATSGVTGRHSNQLNYRS